MIIMAVNLWRNKVGLICQATEEVIFSLIESVKKRKVFEIKLFFPDAAQPISNFKLFTGFN
jgi:hypothetical protein